MAKTKKTTKKTRAQVMSGILRKSVKRPATEASMVKSMLKSYGGSEAEAKYQTRVAVNLLRELDLLKSDGDGKLSLSV